MANALTFIESNIEDLEEDKRIQKIKDDLTAEIDVICKQYPSFCLFKDKLLSKSNDLLDLLLQVFTKSDAKAMELFSKDPSSLLF